jgi:hypothetical protein
MEVPSSAARMRISRRREVSSFKVILDFIRSTYLCAIRVYVLAGPTSTSDDPNPAISCFRLPGSAQTRAVLARPLVEAVSG